MYATGQYPMQVAERKVYGLPMTVRAYKSSLSFMHAQTGLCALITCSSICGLIFSAILSVMLKDTFTKLNDVSGAGKALSTGGSSTVKTDSTYAASTLAMTFGSTMQYAWVSCLLGVCFAAFFGSVLVYIARSFLEKRSADGLKFCCIFEGTFSVCYFLGALAICIYVVLLVMVLVNFTDPKKYCDTTYHKSATSSLAFSKHYQNCMKVVPALKNGLIVFTLWMSCALCINFCASFLCGLGAKFARETEKAFDEEAYSGLVAGQAYY